MVKRFIPNIGIADRSFAVTDGAQNAYLGLFSIAGSLVYTQNQIVCQ